MFAAGSTFRRWSPSLVLLGLIASGTSLAAKEPVAPTVSPIVLELFTSEGCDSCPPADALLAEFAEKPNVIVLSYHVDYWDRLGWKDRFSKRAFTDRQSAYAEAFQAKTVYTPQLVVHGTRELVGSNRVLAERTLRTAQREQAPSEQTLSLTAKWTTPPTKLRVSPELNNKRGEAVRPNEQQSLHLVLIQRHAETDVTKGENRGKHLKHINVVRQLVTVPLDRPLRDDTEFELPKDLQPDEISFVGFIQEQQTAAILTASQIAVPAAPPRANPRSSR